MITDFIRGNMCGVYHTMQNYIRYIMYLLYLHRLYEVKVVSE